MGACQRADAREDINLACTDNAVSALGKFIQYQGQLGGAAGGAGAGGAAAFDAAALVPVWASMLPLTEDHTEGPNVYGLLCSLIERYARVCLRLP